MTETNHAAIGADTGPTTFDAWADGYCYGLLTDGDDGARVARLAARDAWDAAIASAAQPAAVAVPLNELEELNLLNKLIDIGARAASAHAKSNSDDGHAGTAAYVQWQELRADMGELIRKAYTAPTTQAAPQPAASQVDSKTVTNTLCELIDQYWDIAYAEGQEGRTHDTEAGDAQRVRSGINRAIAALTTKSQRSAPGAQGDALDAARYRWLRDGCDTKGSAASRIASDCYGLEWDKLIDAARAKEGAPHEQ